MIWLNISGYDGKYQLSEKGDLRRITEKGDIRLEKSCPASNGKRFVTLFKDKKRKVFMLHNLYAETFEVSVKDAMKILYDGYEGNAIAKDNVKKWLLNKIHECETENKYGGSYSDEILYLKSFLKQLND